MTDIMQWSLAELGAALRDGKTTATALADAAAANHSANSESFGAYKLWEPEVTARQAKAADAAFKSGNDLGPLQGLPISVKDLYGVRGWPTFAGTPKAFPDPWQEEGPVIASIRSQLGVLTGKTHTVEFAFGGIGANPHWGTPRNPWDAENHRAPGGSSSGAGVSLAAGSALLALGTDTAGSVRIPASMTGNAGLKTGVGRWSIAQIAPLSPSLDTAGIMARTVADLAMGFVAIDPDYAARRRELVVPAPAPIEGLRLGVPENFFWNDCSPGIAEGVHEALKEVEKKGVTLVPCTLPEADDIYPIFKVGGLAAVELFAFVKDELPEWFDLIDPIIVQRMEEAATLPAHEYVRRVRVMAELAHSAAARLATIDAMVTPTVPITPPIMADIAAVDDYRPANLLALRNTGIANYLSLCALTMPVALDAAKMPVGMQIMGPLRSEERLLSIGLALEAALGTGRQRLGAPPAVDAN
ncbi:MAG: amidase family protein [Alphaproteobacteria bacterium]|nr:amidase family protein [Alphaproteobacteria bacterium]